MTPIHLIGLWGLAIFMVGVGVLHFVQPKPFVRIVPKFLPAPLALVYISGFFEILGGKPIGVLGGVLVDPLRLVEHPVPSFDLVLERKPQRRGCHQRRTTTREQHEQGRISSIDQLLGHARGAHTRAVW